MKTVMVALAVIALTQSVNAQPSFERVLVPITVATPVPGANGSLWSTSLLVRNNSSAALMVENVIVDCGGILCAPAADLVPSATYRVLPSGGTDRPTAIVSIPSGRSRDLIFTLRVQDLSRQSQTWGTEIPVVREDDLRTHKLLLLDIPTSNSFRSTLRVYDVDGRLDGQVFVRVFGLDPTSPSIVANPTPDHLLGEKTLMLRPPRGGEEGRSPSYLEIGDLTQIAPLGANAAVAVEIEPITPSLRIWSFISVTNNETQHVTAITPR